MSVLASWQRSFREGIVPHVSPAGLMALKQALETDDPALMQGATTSPPPLDCVSDLPVQAACAIAYAGWKGDGRLTVGEVEQFFANVCHRAGQYLGDPTGARWFLNWFDDTPRDQMRRELLAEVSLALAGATAERSAA
jgi:hypothetical protein